MADRTEVLEILEDARQYRDQGVKNDDLSKLKIALAGYKFVIENLTMLKKKDPAPAELYLEAAEFQAALFGTQAKLKSWSVSNMDTIFNSGRKFALKSLDLGIDSFRAHDLNYWFSSARARFTSGLMSAVTNLELGSAKNSLIQFFTDTSSLENFIGRSERLLELCEVSGLDVWHKHEFRQAIVDFDLSTLKSKTKDSKAKEELLSKARRLQRRAKVELNA